MRILVADDDDAIRLLIERMGRAAGHEIVAVGTAAEAADLAAPGDYDAALVDLNLPTAGVGVALVECLLARGVPKVVVITGGGLGADEADRLPSMGVEVVRKPFLVPELLRALGAT